MSSLNNMMNQLSGIGQVSMQQNGLGQNQTANNVFANQIQATSAIAQQATITAANTALRKGGGSINPKWTGLGMMGTEGQPKFETEHTAHIVSTVGKCIQMMGWVVKEVTNGFEFTDIEWMQEANGFTINQYVNMRIKFQSLDDLTKFKTWFN